jgi:hypothetical protein
MLSVNKRWFFAIAAVLPCMFASQAAAQMTASQAISFVQAQHTNAQMASSLAALSPSDRDYVIKYALTPRTVVVTETGSGTAASVNGTGVFDQAGSARSAPSVQPAFARHRQVRAHAAGCGSWSHNFTAKSYSYLGLWQFTFYSDHQWSGCNNKITVDNHQEHGDTAIGWNYNGSSYGAGYGCIGCYMHGREVFGTFGFFKYAVNDTADLQVQVHADGGWWAWANITGP